MPFLPLNQQRQSTEGKKSKLIAVHNKKKTTIGKPNPEKNI